MCAPYVHLMQALQGTSDFNNILVENRNIERIVSYKNKSIEKHDLLTHPIINWFDYLINLPDVFIQQKNLSF